VFKETLKQNNLIFLSNQKRFNRISLLEQDDSTVQPEKRQKKLPIFRSTKDLNVQKNVLTGATR
jgi:hypothetical protein